MKTRTLFLVLILSLCGCSTQKKVEPAYMFGRYNFNYEIEGQAKVGLIQVFDDEKTTYLKFLPMGPREEENVMVMVNKEKLTLLRSSTGFMTFNKTLQSFRVLKGKKEALVQNLSKTTKIEESKKEKGVSL